MLSNSIFTNFHSSSPSRVGIDSVGASQGGCHPPSHQPAATWVRRQLQRCCTAGQGASRT